MNEREIQFPDLNDAFIEASSLAQVSKNYEKLLREQGDFECVLYANKLQQFRKMTLVTKLRELEREFHELKEQVREICKEHNIFIVLTRRKKSFLGINEKIRRSLSKSIPMERVQDLLGFRLVFLTDDVDTIEAIKLCYELMHRIIHYFVTERGCLLTEAEPVVDTGFNPKEYPEIIVPKESFLLPLFEDNVKDYIKTPKRNGYQSLHTVFRKPDGLLFEVQVRTLAMDINAEYGPAAHDPYKAEKYEGENIALDLRKIHLPGFRVLADGTIIDKIGLMYSVDFFNLLTN